MMNSELEEGAWHDWPLSDGSELCGRINHFLLFYLFIFLFLVFVY